MYQLLLLIEQGHVRLLSLADKKLNELIRELSGITRNPPAEKAHVPVLQRNDYLQSLLSEFVAFKSGFIEEMKNEWRKSFVDDEGKKASLEDLVNRYNAEIMRIAAEINTL